MCTEGNFAGSQASNLANYTVVDGGGAVLGFQVAVYLASRGVVRRLVLVLFLVGHCGAYLSAVSWLRNETPVTC